MPDMLALVANAADNTISAFRLTDEGALTPLAITPIARGCSTFAIDEARDLVYLGDKDGPSIVTARLDRATGELTELGRVTAEANEAYLALTPDGGRLLTASYHGGYVSSRLVADGVVGPVVSRQPYANAHSVIATRDGRFAYAASLGDGCVVQNALGDDAALTPLDPPDVPAPRGSGPRHLVLDADETSLYLLTEFTGEVIRFDRAADGTLTTREAVSAVDPDAGLGVSAYGLKPRERHLIWGADLAVAYGALWASERTAGTLATIPLADGTLGDAIAWTTTEPQPRGIGLSPDGRWLIATGELSTTVTLYDVSAGVLVQADQVETGRGANWVRIIATPGR